MAKTAVMRKVTFSLPEDLLREMREVVEEGLFASQNEAVREAVQKELRRARKERLRRAMQEAARDPLFLRDIEETRIAFATADAETARMIPDD